MLYVKIMSGEDLPDTDPHKNFTIVPVERNEVMQFTANPEHVVLMDGKAEPPADIPMPSRYLLLVYSPDGGHETHDLSGNAYVMTESGKTIASHGC